jgi:hypothetical protein
MARIISGTFNGTGAAVYICCGFVPDFVRVRNLEVATFGELIWSKHFRAWAQYGGWEVVSSTPALNTTAGIYPYYGGVQLTSTTAGTTTYGEGEYLKRDPITDYRRVPNASQGVAGDSLVQDVSSWTFVTGLTGYWNASVTGTYIGEGSRIEIDGKWYTITACTSPQLTSANVSLNVSEVPSGVISCITGMYDYVPMVAGETTLDGFYIVDTTVNANGDICLFEAGTYDN